MLSGTDPYRHELGEAWQRTKSETLKLQMEAYDQHPSPLFYNLENLTLEEQKTKEAFFLNDLQGQKILSLTHYQMYYYQYSWYFSNKYVLPKNGMRRVIINHKDLAELYK